MKMKLLILFTVMIVAGCTTEARIGEIVFTVESDDYDLVDTPVTRKIESKALSKDLSVCLLTENSAVPGQIEFLSDDEYRIWWLADQKAGETVDYRLTVNEECASRTFSWKAHQSEATRLYYGELPVLQYEHPQYDPEDIEHTKKPFHHVFDPVGTDRITKGPGGLYSHHRGIFYGYYAYIGDDEERIDIWHANDGERSEHEEVIKEYSGPVTGGHVVRINWKDHHGEPFAEEIREVRVYPQGRGELAIDFHSELTSLIDEPLHLGGDRQHAGVHFRAAQGVADQEEENGSSRFIRPDQLSHLGEREEIDGNDMMDLPWNAFHFTVNDRPYTVTYLVSPSNADEAEMSERLYGRFGEFIPRRLAPGESLELTYRFRVTAGYAPDTEEIEHRYQLYAEPPDVELKRHEPR